MRKKVSIIGAGNVGGATAMRLSEKELADVILAIDILPGMPAGKALDLTQAAAIEGSSFHINGMDDDYTLTKDSDIVVVTAGFPRTPGMTRDDLLSKNAEIVRSVVKKIITVAPDSILIIVTNPLDAMCHVAFEASGFDRKRIIGMAGVLDSARFRTFISMELNVSVENVQACVLGAHGDTMVPLPRYSTVAGVPITELLPADRIEALVERTRQGGTEIVNLLKTGGAYYAPSSAITEMVEAILKDKKKILPCVTYLQGEYGIHDIFVGVPVKLGSDGIEEIIELKLTKEENEALQNSAKAVQGLLDDLKRLG